MLTLPRKLWVLLTVRERWQLAGLSGMVTFMGLAQVVGVGSIAPFMTVLFNPESVQTNEWLRQTFERLDFESTNSFLLFLALAVLVALVVANGFLALTQWVLIRFVWALQHRLSRRLLEAYLAQPYIAFLQRNSADTGKNVLYEVERLRIATFATAGLSLIGFLFWTHFGITFAVIAVLGGGYGIVYMAARRILALAGHQRIQANSERYKVVGEAFGGIKEIKVLGRESALLGQYDEPARRFAGAMATEGVVSQLPRYALEVIAAGAVLIGRRGQGHRGRRSHIGHICLGGSAVASFYAADLSKCQRTPIQ